MTDVLTEERAAAADLVAPEALAPIAAPTPERRAPTRRDVLIVVAAGCTLFGIFVLSFAVYLVGITRFEHGRSQRSLLEQFDASLENQSAPAAGRIDEGTPVATMRIPSLGVREVVVEGTSGTQLKKGPGHLRASPFPGQAGNVVVAGRRLTYGAPFLHIDQLGEGDEIVFVTGQGEMVYRVEESRRIDEGDDDVLQPTTDNRLTLITSAPFTASERYAVIADLQGRPVPSRPEERPTEIRSGELGINTEGSNLLPLVLWLQLLLVASLLAVWLIRTQSRTSVYLVMTPVLLLLVLLVFDSASSLLPSTL